MNKSSLFRLFRNRFLLIAAASLLSAAPLLAQREYVPTDNPVYKFLLRQNLAGRLPDFYWGMLPLSRHDVASQLLSLKADSVLRSLSDVDQRLVREYLVEFSYDISGSLDQSRLFIPGFSFADLAQDDQRRYLYAYADSDQAVFIDGLGSLTKKVSSGDSLGRAGAMLGELGVRIRGTFHDHLGFYLQATNGSLMSGSHALAALDHRLLANRKFNSDEGTFYDQTIGYLRYDADWIAVTAGREQLSWGVGYASQQIFSDNTAPFDYLRLDLRSKSFRYAFLHGSLVGNDSLGHNLSSKYIAAHRVEFNSGRRVRVGFSEAVIYANQPVNFAMMNPFTFLTSAELSTEVPTAGDDEHNSIIWLDADVRPVNDVRLYGSLLVDDLKFSTIGKGDISGNTNKFGWQGGMNWTEPLALPGVMVVVEYNRINPFVMSHWTNIANFTSWNLSLGPSITPNSDEWLVGSDVDLTPRLALRVQARLQRSGESIRDQNGVVTFDAGDDITHGENHLKHPNVFLQGNRVNRQILAASIEWQPLRQYFMRLDGWTRWTKYLATDRRLHDSVLSLTLRVDY